MEDNNLHFKVFLVGARDVRPENCHSQLVIKRNHGIHV